MNEHELRRSLAASAAAAIPDGSRLMADVVTLAVTRRAARRPRFRFRIAVLGAVVLATLTAAGALAVASGTLPIQFNLVEIGRPAAHKLDGTAPDKAMTDPAKRAAIAAEASAKAAGAGDPKQEAAPAAKVQRDDVAMSLADAEAAFGAHVLVAPDQAPAQVTFREGETIQRQKSSATSFPDQVTLTYTVAGTQVSVVEELEDATTPLTVDALNQDDGPMMKADGGLGHAAIETVAGGQYAVGSTVDGLRVSTVIFKSGTGVAVHIRFEGGVSHDVALAFATTMQ